MLKHLLILSGITLFGAIIAVPVTNYVFLFGDWWSAYILLFGTFETVAISIYLICLLEFKALAESQRADEYYSDLEHLNG